MELEKQGERYDYTHPGWFAAVDPSYHWPCRIGFAYLERYEFS
jgi:hypothetical protein